IIDFLDCRAYRTWFEAWRSGRSPSEQGLLRLLIAQRNAEVHRDGADLDRTVNYVPITELPSHGSGHPAYYGFHWAGPPGMPPPAVGVRVHYLERDGARVEAFDTSKAIGTLKVVNPDTYS